MDLNIQVIKKAGVPPKLALELLRSYYSPMESEKKEGFVTIHLKGEKDNIGWILETSVSIDAKSYTKKNFADEVRRMSQTLKRTRLQLSLQKKISKIYRLI